MSQSKASAPPPPPPPPIGQPYPIETAFEPPGPINDLYRIAAVDFITLLSKIGMKVLSDYRVYGRDKISDATMRRAPGRPLLSVSNHRCVVDDPATLSAMLTWSEVHQINRMRWGLCAREVCFKKKFLEPFFQAVKVFPIERGAGVYQPSMQTLQLRFNAGEWVHIFPEGRVVQTEDLGPFKWGMHWLV
jgi:monolysocardiolipin acyltransferase